MVQVLVQELISPHEALKTLKPYLRSNMPAVVLKILTVGAYHVQHVVKCCAVLHRSWMPLFSTAGSGYTKQCCWTSGIRELLD